MKPDRDRPLWLQLAHAFKFAGNGLVLLSRDRNMRIHVAATVLVVVAGAWLRVTPMEWVALVFAITLVLAFEAMNTALELTVDLASPDVHPVAGQAKDLSAAAVTIAASGAAVVGVIILGPRLWAQLAF
jgi:diacylglycerol kinase